MLKTYIMPSMASCTIVQRAAMSQFKDAACKYPLPRIAHNFIRNADGCAQFSTDDAAVQEFIESRPTFKMGQIIILNEAGPKPSNPDALPKVRQGVTQAAPEEAPEKPEAPKPAAVRRGGAKTAKLK